MSGDHNRAGNPPSPPLPATHKGLPSPPLTPTRRGGPDDVPRAAPSPPLSPMPPLLPASHPPRPLLLPDSYQMTAARMPILPSLSTLPRLPSSRSLPAEDAPDDGSKDAQANTGRAPGHIPHGTAPPCSLGGREGWGVEGFRVPPSRRMEGGSVVPSGGTAQSMFRGGKCCAKWRYGSFHVPSRTGSTALS